MQTNARASAGDGKTAVVMGLGATGLSCVRHLDGAGYALHVMDTRSEPPGLDALRSAWPDVAVHTGGWDDAVLAEASLLAVSPGIAADEPVLVEARSRGIDVAGDIELFARATTRRTVAITGTNGKSTVTDLLGALLRSRGWEVGVGGNLGPPALDLLGSDARDGFVLELSSFQLDLVTTLPLACACILNVSADHLDRYGSMDAYAASKQRIYRDAACAVYNAADPATAPDASFDGERVAVAPLGAAVQAPFGVRRLDGVPWVFAADQPVMAACDLRIAGAHNAFNVAAALAVLSVLGVAAEDVLPALEAYGGLPHRCVEIGRVDGVRFVDDSKATNVGATLAAVEGLADAAGDLVVIVGGLGKGGDFSLLREAFARDVRHVVLIGADAPLIAAALDGAVSLETAGSMDEAVQRAAGMAGAGDTVLLAPACASFDMFDNYIARGEAFAAAVGAIAGEVAS